MELIGMVRERVARVQLRRLRVRSLRVGLFANDAVVQVRAPARGAGACMIVPQTLQVRSCALP